jgi:nucleotide-binding universal stress UspA family protein
LSDEDFEALVERSEVLARDPGPQRRQLTAFEQLVAAHRIVIFQDALERGFGSDPDLLAAAARANHGVEVVGMFFFDDNTYVPRAGDPLGERLAEVAEEQGIMLMLCDRRDRALARGG